MLCLHVRAFPIHICVVSIQPRHPELDLNHAGYCIQSDELYNDKFSTLKEAQTPKNYIS